MYRRAFAQGCVYGSAALASSLATLTYLTRRPPREATVLVDNVKRDFIRQHKVNTFNNHAIKPKFMGENEGQNAFHPGDLVTALRLDYSGYSPSGVVGAIQLACHLLGEGRDFSKEYIKEDAAGVVIDGYETQALPRIQSIQAQLREQFPDVAEYADSLSKRDLKALFKSSDEIDLLTSEIEKKFGKSIMVPFVSKQKQSIGGLR